ncbi:HNH endonuclease [Shewanella corallii]|uniref:HNH endonuclease n=1 Tax=Shewanella corallii TaxID=560080 RepID=A0ABT0N4L6_9GAMM|nr:HNH endonuclease signature motif containing protein [Shewanella corallii]MCL2913030.1 HNH endonuclease [Shewanella corallii]
MSDTPLLPDTLLPVGEVADVTVVEVGTDTNVTNTRHYMLLKDVPVATGLDPADVAQKASETSSDKVTTINGKRYVRLSTARRWNLPNMQSANAELQAQAQKFHQDTQLLLSRPESIQRRSIAASTVESKSNIAKQEYRRKLDQEGKGDKCERSGVSTANEKAEVHHKKRVADRPELAAETSNMELLLRPVHKEEHRGDKKG